MKKFIQSASIIAFLFLLLNSNLFAQMVILPSGSAPSPSVIQSYLSGNGVTIANATYVGNNNAVAGFMENGSNIGLSSGMILTTGTAANATGPNVNTNTSTSWGTAGDVDLNAMLGDTIPTSDAAILEFDVMSESDSIFMKFVYASEGYNEQIGTAFADPIGIFISGPGIVGKKNVALVPNSTVPVNIDGINSGINYMYYNDNTGGTTVGYDGFTVPIIAHAEVQPCMVYHVKIVIADANDQDYDSAILIETGSLVSGINNPTNCVFEAQFVYSDIVCDGYLGKIDTLSVMGGFPPYTYTINGNSFTTFPVMNLMPGNYHVLIIDAIGAKDSADFVMSAPNCDVSAIFSKIDNTCYADIFGNPLMEGSIDTISISGGVYPYTITKNENTINTFPITGLASGTYAMNITDALGNAYIENIVIGPSQLVLTTNSIGAVCVGDTFDATLDYSGGVSPYIIYFNNLPFDTIDTNNYSFTAQANTYYIAYIKDANNCIVSDTMSIATQEFGYLEGDIKLNGSLSFLVTGESLEVILLRKSLLANTVWENYDVMYFTDQDPVYHYAFDSISSNAQYVVLAKVINSTHAQEILPTYSGNKHIWSQSVPLTIIGGVCNLHTDNIDLVNSIGQSIGTGSLSGIITLFDFYHKTETNNDPIPLIDIVIEKDSLPKSGILVPESPLGSNQFPYDFTALPAGQYKVRVQIPGIPMINNYAMFTIVTNNITQVDFCADTFNLGVIDTCNSFSVSIKENTLNTISIFPNPSSNFLNIYQDYGYQTKLSISEMSGRVVMAADLTSRENSISTQSLSNGVYLIKISNGNRNHIEKLIITH